MTGSTRLALNMPWDGLQLHEHRPHLERLLDAGYSEIWTGESNGLDAVTPLATVAGWLPRAIIGCGIANVFFRGPALLAMQAAALSESGAAGVRFGVGPGTRVFAESWNGATFAHPAERVAHTLRFLREVLTTGRASGPYPVIGVEGFRLARVPARPPSLLVGALGPRLQAVAAAEADGLILSMASPHDAGRVRDEVAVMERSMPTPLELVAATLVVAGDRPEAARTAARRVLAAYLAVPGYARAQERFGRGPALASAWERWSQGDRKGATDAIPDGVVDDLVALGSPADAAARVREFASAGVGTAVVTVVPVPGQNHEGRTEFLAALAREVQA